MFTTKYRKIRYFSVLSLKSLNSRKFPTGNQGGRIPGNSCLGIPGGLDRRVKSCENTISSLIHDIEAQKDCIQIHKWIILFIYKIPIITWNTKTKQDVDNEWRHWNDRACDVIHVCNRRQPSSVGQLAALGLAM